MAYKITIEGDDKDELIAAAKGLVEMLEGEAAAEEETEVEDDTTEDDTTEDDTTEDDTTEDDDNAELIGKIRKQIAKLIKSDTGPGKVKAALAKVGAKKLDQVKAAKLPTVAKLLGVK